MRIASCVALGAGLLAVAPPAQAGPVPKYSELPAGQVTTMPLAKKPAFIPANERVAGFFVAMPKVPPMSGKRFGMARPNHVTVVGSAKVAEAIRKGEPVRDADHDEGMCFSDSELHSAAEVEGDSDGDEEKAGSTTPTPAPREWSLNQGYQAILWPKTEGNDGAGIGAVHSERLVRDGSKLTLESVDAWVDPGTRGARLIARANLPLIEVGSAIGGVKVYAGRDGRRVQFVIVRAKGGDDDDRLGSITAMRMDGASSHGSECGHIRMPLAVEPTDGDSAVVIATVDLSGAKPAPVPAAAKLKAMVTKLGKPSSSPPMQPSQGGGEGEREVRTRDMQIHLSVSQTTTDEDPLVAVSFGWVAREQVQRVAADVALP